MQTQTYLLKNSYGITVQKIGETSHIIITDHNIYPDDDSRSQDDWRHNGLLIPINNKKDFKKIYKMFKKLK